MTTDNPVTPEDDGTVGAAVFLLELGGKWTTDCGCVTVVDGTRWAFPRRSDGEPIDTTQWRRYIAAYDYTSDDGRTGAEIVAARHDPLAVVVDALEHACDGRKYIPLETMPVG